MVLINEICFWQCVESNLQNRHTLTLLNKTVMTKQVFSGRGFKQQYHYLIHFGPFIVKLAAQWLRDVQHK